MMYLVTYTLTPARQDPNLENEFTRSAAWLHPIDNTWAVVTQEPIQVLYNRLAIHLASTDRILIVEVKPDAPMWGILNQDAWEWFTTLRHA